MATKQPFGNPFKKNEIAPTAPKKSVVRDQCKNMFVESLKETPGYPDEFYKEMAERIENEIFGLFNGDTSKNYRDKVNAMKMKLKGQRNSSIRSAFLDSRITPNQLVTSENITEVIENSFSAPVQQPSKSIEHPVLPSIQKPLPGVPGKPNPMPQRYPVQRQVPPVVQTIPQTNIEQVEQELEQKPSKQPVLQEKPVKSEAHRPQMEKPRVEHKEEKPRVEHRDEKPRVEHRDEKPRIEHRDEKPRVEHREEKPRVEHRDEKPRVEHREEKPRIDPRLGRKEEKTRDERPLQKDSPQQPIRKEQKAEVKKPEQERPPQIVKKEEVKTEEIKRPVVVPRQEVKVKEQEIEITYQKEQEDCENENQDDLEREIEEFERLRKMKNEETNEDPEEGEFYAQEEALPQDNNEEGSNKLVDYENNSNPDFEANKDENLVMVMDSNPRSEEDNNNNNNAYENPDEAQEGAAEYNSGEGYNEGCENEEVLNIVAGNEQEGFQIDQQDQDPDPEANNPEENLDMPEMEQGKTEFRGNWAGEEGEEMESNQAILGSKEGYAFSRDETGFRECEEGFIKFVDEEAEERKDEGENDSRDNEEEGPAQSDLRQEASPEKVSSPVKHDPEELPKRDHSEVNNERPQQEFIKVMHLELELATEKKKNEYAVSQIEVLKRENSKLKNQLEEAQHQLALREDVEALKRSYAAKDKECEGLKQERNDLQEELKIMKSHLNKMIESNSKFKEDYLSFKAGCEQETQALRDQLESLKSKESDDQIMELEALKSKNHVLEEKLRILNQKLESTKKDSIEKEALIKKMETASTLSENDFQLFHNLTLELQKQASALQSFQLRGQSFKPQAPKEQPQHYVSPGQQFNEKIHENPVRVMETPVRIMETPVRVVETPPRQQENNQIRPESLPKIVETPKVIEAPPKLAEKQKLEEIELPIQINQGEALENQKEQEERRVELNQSQQTHLPEEKSPLKEPSVHSLPPKTQPQEGSHFPIENSQNAEVKKLIEPPPLAFKKKLEEKKNSPPVARNPIAGAFNHPKLAARNNAPVTVPPKSTEPMKLFVVNNMEGENAGEQFFSNLASHPQVQVREPEKKPQATPSEPFNKPDETKKGSPQRPVFSQLPEKEAFRTINPGLFADQKDDFANLFQSSVQSQKNERKELPQPTHIPKQASNKNLPTQNFRNVGQSQNVSLTKSGPNMESTTSLHSTMTEGEIKKGPGVRKGVIPGGLFD